VIQRLVQFSTKPPPVCRARVIMPPGFEPKSGSVRPKQPIALPLASRGSRTERRWFRGRYSNAESPVMSRPSVSRWTSSVPS